MSRIIRSIRQKLLTNNKVSKYLLFALGEIALIILGILLALQIDNKNQEKHNLKLEKEYLLSMQTELTLSLENPNSLIEKLKYAIDDLDIIIDSHNKHNRIPIDPINKLYQQILFVPEFRDQTETFESIESSGHLSLLKNMAIKHDYFRLLKEYEAFAGWNAQSNIETGRH